MTRLSIRAERAVQDFATSVGLPAVAAADASYSFRFEDGALLNFTPTEGEANLAVSLAFPPDRDDESRLLAALSLAGPDEATDLFLHAGRSSDGLIILAVRLPDERADLPAIDDCLRRLRELRRAIAA